MVYSNSLGAVFPSYWKCTNFHYEPSCPSVVGWLVGSLVGCPNILKEQRALIFLIRLNITKYDFLVCFPLLQNSLLQKPWMFNSFFLFPSPPTLPYSFPSWEHSLPFLPSLPASLLSLLPSPSLLSISLPILYKTQLHISSILFYIFYKTFYFLSRTRRRRKFGKVKSKKKEILLKFLNSFKN